MIGANIAQSRLGYTGRGVHVAVIDSGIDNDNPDLGGCFGAGCRVTKGYDLVGDDYDEEESDPGWQPVAHPDADRTTARPRHARRRHRRGERQAARRALDVTFSAYRVFGCSGPTSTNVMLAAMERAYRDGADVLNMSIGESRNAWPQAPVAEPRRAWPVRASAWWPSPGTITFTTCTRRRARRGQGRHRRRVGRQPQAVLAGIHDLSGRPRRGLNPGNGSAPIPPGVTARAAPARRAPARARPGMPGGVPHDDRAERNVERRLLRERFTIRSPQRPTASSSCCRESRRKQALALHLRQPAAISPPLSARHSPSSPHARACASRSSSSLSRGPRPAPAVD